MESISKIKTGLALTASFSDADVKKAIYLMLDSLDTDLNTAGYVPGEDSDACLVSLEESIEDVNEEKMLHDMMDEEAKVAAEIEAEEEVLRQEEAEAEEDEVDEDLAIEAEIEDVEDETGTD